MIHKIKSLYPGIICVGVIALAAQFVSDHYGAPTMLMALLFGMALNFLAKERCKEGVQFSAKKILRIGVALLGVRISFSMIMELGWEVIALIVGSVLATIGFGFLIGRLLKTDKNLSFLTAGSVAICGASAAMAISAILPKEKAQEERLLFTVAGVTVLSTIAMVLYPVLVAYLGMDMDQSGVFFGATIHDVAQVVGAGYSVSDTTGDVATIVKLLRVAMLAPVILTTSLLLRDKHSTSTKERPPVLPGFMLAFCALVFVNSFQLIPDMAVELLSQVSRAALVMAIAAVGMKINLGELKNIGRSAVLLIVSETMFVALLVGVVLMWIIS